VQLFIDFGLIKGEIVSTDGQLEPTHSRFKGCAYACKGCQELPLDEAQRHNLAQHLQSGSMPGDDVSLPRGRRQCPTGHGQNG
jgi:hypothetical protein